MKSLRSRSFFLFLFSTGLVLVIGSPLFYFIMKGFYTGDLDEVIEYRAERFIQHQLPILSHIEIEMWNTYNPDLTILDYNELIPLNQPFQESFYSKERGFNIDYRVLYTTVNIEGVPHLIQSRIPMIDTFDLIKTIFYQFALVFLFILLIQLVTQRLVVRRFWRPFNKTLDKIDQFNIVDEQIPDLPQSNITEFERLNQNLTTLMNRATASYKQQKQFLENASHELQTPLAIIQSQLDLLVQDPDLTAAQNQVIQALYHVSASTRRLNKNLLLLARIDNNQFSQLEEVDLKNLLTNTIELFAEIANMEGIKIYLQVDQATSIQANLSLIGILINNLISNGIKYNNKEGIIHIKLLNKVFSVSNTSDAPALNEEEIFGRFVRRNTTQSGSGLGLAIVHQICDFHGWILCYQHMDGKHQFVVDFNISNY